MVIGSSHGWDGSGAPGWNGVGIAFDYDAVFIVITAKFDILIGCNWVFGELLS